MKITTSKITCLFCICGTFLSVTVGIMDTVLAESTVSLPSQTVLNGLYSPTASERFFEEGKRKIERETQILVNPEISQGEGILQNNVDNTKTIEQLEETNPILNFPEDSLQ